MSSTIIDAGRTGAQSPLSAPPPAAPAVPLTGFAAGITGAGLLVAGAWGLHAISGGVSAGAVVLLLAAFTALGKGITLLQRALAPLTQALAAAVSAVPVLVRTLAAITVGGIGLWWVLRGHAAIWWAHITNTPVSWTLTSELVQVAIITVAGALLFGGAKSLAGLVVPASSGRPRHGGGDPAGRSSRERWASWWSTRPGLGLLLLAGAAAIVAFSGYVVPKVSGWLLGGDPTAALAAIVAVLAAGLIANTWWWGALSGWWAWAHRPHTPGGGATPMGQMHAGAAVVALLWFSATAFGLAVPDSYTGPGAMPRAHADCPPDCGGNGGGSGSSGPAFPIQPPNMPNPPGGYPSGSYPAPDQGNGISIYNQDQQQPSSSRQSGSPQAPSYPQQLQPANGQQPLDYDAPLQTVQPSQPQNTGRQQPTQQSQQSQAPSVPQLPTPQQQAPQPSQEPDAPQPQDQPTQQPAQQPQQQTQQQNQPCQQQAPAPPAPSPNDAVDPTNLAAAATRRGGRQASEQGTQQATKTARIEKQSGGLFKQDVQDGEYGPYSGIDSHKPQYKTPLPPQYDPNTGAAQGGGSPLTGVAKALLEDEIGVPAVASRAVGPSTVTTLTEDGGQAVYQGLDALGRPTGVTARITPDMLRTGSKAAESIRPPGFAGQAADPVQARGHLLAKVLGGSGKVPENLVTLIQSPVNSPVMRGFEVSVAKAVDAGQVVEYVVTPLYKGTELIPAAVQIIAKGSQGFYLAVTVLNG